MLFVLRLAAGVLLLTVPSVPSEVRFELGPVNSVIIGSHTPVYSAPTSSPGIQRLLLPHARRNAVGTVPKEAVVIVPAAEQDLFKEPERFWSALEGGRFHDYAQKSTKVPVLPLSHVQAVVENT